MKLFYKPGACSLAPHIALRVAGATFELEQVDTTKKTTASGSDYQQINPKGYVPALLLDSGEVLTEAPAILQYIADLYPAAALAPSPHGLARARLQEHLNFISSELHKAFSPFFGAAPLADTERPAVVAKISRRFAIFEAQLSKGGPYLMGDTFTVADAYFFVVANWANFVDISLSQWPHIAHYMDRASDLPAIKQAMVAEGLIN